MGMQHQNQNKIDKFIGGQICMKDPVSAELKEKSSQYSMNFHDNSKNKNWKINFSFVLHLLRKSDNF